MAEPARSEAAGVPEASEVSLVAEVPGIAEVPVVAEIPGIAEGATGPESCPTQRPAGLELLTGTEAAEDCPNTRELAVLQRWHSLHTGVRRLNDGLLADVEAAAGLAPSSFQALMFLMTAPGQAAPMNRLSQSLGFSTAGTTKVVDRLAAAGLVERRPSDSDRRVTFTALTPAGAESVLTASRSLAQALRTRVVEPLGEDLFGTLCDAIGSLDPDPEDCG